VMAWLARRWARREAQVWPARVASTLLGIFSLQVLVLMAMYAQTPAPETPVAGPAAPSTPITLAEAVAIEPEALPPTSTGYSNAAGTWHAVIDNDLQTAFVLQHRGAAVWMESNVFTHEGSPTMRMLAQGQIQGRQLALDLHMQSQDGQALDLPQGKLMLEISPDGKTMVGTLHFAGDPAMNVRMTRR
jgi:hypothetical protein